MEYIKDLEQYITPPTNIKEHFSICYQIPSTKEWWIYRDEDFAGALNICRFLVSLGRSARVKDKDGTFTVSSLKELNLFYNRVTDRYGIQTEFDFGDR